MHLRRTTVGRFRAGALTSLALVVGRPTVPAHAQAAPVSNGRALVRTMEPQPAGAGERWAVPDTLLSAASLLGDVDLLVRAEEALHPGLYRYQSPAAWRARVAALRRDVAAGMTQRALFARIAELTAGIRCGHSYPNFFNQGRAVRERVVEASARLPFLFRWRADTMVVSRDLRIAAAGDERETAPAHASGAVASGTRVVAIDGVPTARVLARLLPMVRADGANDAKRRELLAVTGNARYEAFDVYYPLRFALGDSVTLDVLPPSAGRRGESARRPTRIRVATQSFAVREAVRSRLARAADAPSEAGSNPLRWSLVLRPDSTAVLAMPSWSTYGQPSWNWRAWLDSAFMRLQASGARRLVLDLRENEGGNDAVQRALLTALARRPVRVERTERYVRYRTLPDGLRPYADTWDRTFDDWSNAIEPGVGLPGARGPGGVALHRLRADRQDADTAALTTFTAPPPRRVAVLVGPVNSSSTFAFAQAVKRERLAVLVGEPTGGNLRGINGGAYYFFRLPGSGVEVDIPLIGYFPAETGPGPALERLPDAGLVPDVIVRRPGGALGAGEDPAITAAVAALRR